MFAKKKPADDTKLKFAPMGAKPGKKFDPSDERVKTNLKSKKSKKTAKTKSKAKTAALAQKAAMTLASKG